MKSIKAFLQTEREKAYTMWAAELQKEGDANMVLVAWWNDRILHVEGMIKELNNNTKA